MKYHLGDKFNEKLEIVAINMNDEYYPYYVRVYGANGCVSNTWYTESDIDELYQINDHVETNLEHYLDAIVAIMYEDDFRESSDDVHEVIENMVVNDSEDFKKWLCSEYEE